MRLEFIGIGEDRIWDVRYDFYIVYEDEEDKYLEIYEKEFKLNCKHQL